MKREYKFVPLTEFKVLDSGNGGLEGYLARFNNVDDGGDRILPGAFADTLDEFKTAGWQALNHDWEALPIGWIDDAKEDDTGLFVRFMYHSHQAAQDARTVAKERLAAGRTVGLSIGYEIPAGGSQPGKDGSRRELVKLNLFEGSQVNAAMNRDAMVTAVKGRSVEEKPGAESKYMPMMYGGEPMEGSFEDVIEDVREALNSALGSSPWSGSYACVLATFGPPLSPEWYCYALTMTEMGDESRYWRVPFTLDAEGDPVLGTPEEVQPAFVPVAAGGVEFMGHALRLAVTAKEFIKRAEARRERRVKEGRELSGGNRQMLGQIIDALDGCVGQLKDLHARTDPAPVSQEKAVDVADLELAFLAIQARAMGVALSA